MIIKYAIALAVLLILALEPVTCSDRIRRLAAFRGARVRTRS